MKSPSCESDAAATVGPCNKTWALFLVSVLGLYIELMLIRWISTEVRIFAYLQNTVLVVCFLGLGMGCFTSKRPVSMRGSLLAMLSLAVLLAVPFTRQALENVTHCFSLMDDFVIWEPGQKLGMFSTAGRIGLSLGVTLLLMLLLWEVFLPMGRILGRGMNEHSHPIWAYTANVAGSLAGIGLFVLVSALWLPPVLWVAVAVGLLIPFLGRSREQLVNLGLSAALIGATWFASRDSVSREIVWSPYQKLVLKKTETRPDQKLFWAGQQLILVNNAHYQGIIDLGAESVRRNTRIPENRWGLSQYDIPLLLHPHPKRVLIVGAGSGNDVAGALRGGAEQVTAVEIDPAIVEMGRHHHPEKPYQSPKTRIVIDDARSFFATTHEKFDLIIFGLLDSHTTTAMTNARLDHYVYTRESIERARALLDHGGVMALSFEPAKLYIADRMATCLREVFDNTAPLTFRVPHDGLGWGGVMFVAGDQPAIAHQLEKNPQLATVIREWQTNNPVPLTYSASVTTDDWPYIYLEHARVPKLYFLLFLATGALVYRCSRKLQLPMPLVSWRRPEWHFFCLGAAFLLLEVQNISKAAVVLGNTWVVNAIIIGGVLVMILVANLIAAKFPKIPQDALTVCLIGSCLGLYFLDLARFAFLPYATKALVVGALTCLPMLFSGIIFIRSFAATDKKDLALGANMYGSVLGAMLQSVTFILGIKTLLLVVAALYMAASLLTRATPTKKRVTGQDLDETNAGADDSADDQSWELAETT